LSIGGHQDSLLIWGGLSAIPSLWYQFGTFLSLPSTWFLVQPLADSRKYTKEVVSNILESHGGRIEDNKKHGAVFDMDPSAHYEIDRSELEPMEHIPPLSKGPDEEIRVVKWRGTKVAAKTIYLPLTEDPEVFNKLKLQLLMLEQMRHPNIVQFLCAVTRSQPIVIVTEYLPGGKLNDIISKGRIPTRKALSFALDIARYTLSFAL
jgi:serine/threonine protein kinase